MEALQQLILDEPPNKYSTYNEFEFHQMHRHINPNYIILDTGSMSDIFCSKKLVSNICLSSGSLKVHCNAGTKVIKHVATLKDYGTRWFNEEGITNILSMSLVKKRFSVRYDSTEGVSSLFPSPKKM
jgi:hypothetical protein